ncbi:MAG TPA: AgmX/PglI C-terminal domain-containing protein [Myxococcales bacterium LLY-WYZ-16_1]|nr:AgmX/PglI C-terminal domain-containing protein [Myxococcales bacterium LLY-WYZ-16_1]
MERTHEDGGRVWRWGSGRTVRVATLLVAGALGCAGSRDLPSPRAPAQAVPETEPASEPARAPSRSLPPEAVNRVIQENLPRFASCYEAARADGLDREGGVRVMLLIAPDGAVAQARIEDSELDHPPVEECITETLRSLRFPKPPHGGLVSVTYPFTFTRD